MWSKQVREARIEMGLSQPEFAEMLGVSVRTVIRWERGHTAIKGYQLQNIVDRYGKPFTAVVRPRKKVSLCVRKGCNRPVAVGRKKYCSKRCATINSKRRRRRRKVRPSAEAAEQVAPEADEASVFDADGCMVEG